MTDIDFDKARPWELLRIDRGTYMALKESQSKSDRIDAFGYAFDYLQRYRQRGWRALLHRFLYWLIHITTKKYKYNA